MLVYKPMVTTSDDAKALAQLARERGRIVSIAIEGIYSAEFRRIRAMRDAGELGLEASAAGVAARYGDLLDAYVVDHADAAIGNVGARITIAKTLMTSLHDRKTLARVTLDAAEALASR